MGNNDHTPHETASSKNPAEAMPGGGEKGREEVVSEKAKDLLRADRIDRRLRLGERLLQRVGGRMWDRPNVAVSHRLYKRFQLDDPWAPPGSKSRKSAVGLGPVSLRFGEKRRQPAPHLKPKAPKKKKGPGAVDPVAKYRRPKPTPKPQASSQPTPAARPPTPKPAAPKPSGPQGKYAITGSSGEFGKTEKRGLVGNLPVRPDLQKDGKTGTKKPSASPSRPRSASGGPARTPPVRSMPKPAAMAPKTSSRPQPRTRSATPGKPPGGGGGGGGVPLPRPKLPTPKKKRAGRFRMSPTEVRSPIVKKVVAPEPVVRAADAAAPTMEVASKPKRKAKPEKPIDRSIPTGPMGLNDLFGAMDGGRMRVGRRKKTEEEGEDQG